VISGNASFLLRLEAFFNTLTLSSTAGSFLKLSSDFEVYFDDPVFQNVLYSLFRAGAQPAFPDMLKRKRSNTSRHKVEGRKGRSGKISR
jgi:hypothetical protein